MKMPVCSLYRRDCMIPGFPPMRSILVPLLALTALLAACAVAPGDRAAPSAASLPTKAPSVVQVAIPSPVATRHFGTFDGVRVPYTATVEQHVLKDAKGHPAATITTIAYVRSDVSDRAQRPVLFAFNGGPGASTSPLQMEALGPYRWKAHKGASEFSSGKWQNNQYSPLDATDIVLIDPPGTGYSRTFSGDGPEPWYTSEGDAKAVKMVIADWLKAHHREASPHYLLGESYGTIRAALILKNSKKLRFNGVLLVALVGDASGHVMPYVTSLPTMAAGAWFHHKIARDGRSVGKVYRQALKFARTDYAEALIRGSSLPAARKHAIAARMSKFIGLPVGLIEKHDLRISKNTFMFNLLRDKDLRTGMLDMRVTAPLEPGQLGALDDPALGVVPKGKRKPGAPPLTPASIGPVSSPKVAEYMRQVLKVPFAGPYIGVNFSVNAAWKYGDSRNAMSDLGKVMQADPHLRLFWVTGYYDLTTPSYAARFTLDQDGIPPGQLTAVYLPGPHSAYAGDENLARFSAALRKFVTAKPAQDEQAAVK